MQEETITMHSLFDFQTALLSDRGLFFCLFMNCLSNLEVALYFEALRNLNFCSLKAAHASALRALRSTSERPQAEHFLTINRGHYAL